MDKIVYMTGWILVWLLQLGTLILVMLTLIDMLKREKKNKK